MIDLQKLIAQAEHHIRRGDSMQMDPEVVLMLANRCLSMAGEINRLNIHQVENKFDEMEANDQRWRHFLGFLTDSDRAIDFHERFSKDRVPTPEESIAGIIKRRLCFLPHPPSPAVRLNLVKQPHGTATNHGENQ